MKSKRIVVDTSIARASGPPNSIKPISSHCRDFLLAIREICHKIVFTNDILDEWNKHQSKFAASWRVSMKSKSKTILLKGSALKKLSRDSRKNIELINSSEAEAIKKDALLIEAAKSTDMIIASLDDSMRYLLKDNKDKISELKELMWINPSNEEENVIQWLKDGAEADEERFLAQYR